MLREISWHRHRLNVVDEPGSFWDKFESGEWEPETRAFLAERVRPDMVFIDLGAWVGPTTLIAAALGARVVAFEPNPASLDLMRRSVEASGLAERVTLVPKAIWTAAGQRQLSVGSATSGSSLVVRKPRHNLIDVACELPAYLEQFIVPGSTLLKIDVEGAEYDIFADVASIVLQRQADILLSIHPHKAVDHRKKASFLRNPALGGALLRRLLRLRQQVGRFPAAKVVESRGSTFTLRAPTMVDFFRASQFCLEH